MTYNERVTRAIANMSPEAKAQLCLFAEKTRALAQALEISLAQDTDLVYKAIPDITVLIAVTPCNNPRCPDGKHVVEAQHRSPIAHGEESA